MELREYQKEIVSKMLWSYNNLIGNDVVSACQGSGKSLIIADFAHKIGKPILILVPSKELLEQNVSKMLNYVDKSEVSIFSASMKQKEVGKITFGTIQSVYKHPEKFLNFGVCIVDEGDLVPLKKLSGMYRKFFKQTGIKKVFGMTGTPFRQDTFYKEPPQGWARYKAQRWKNYSDIEVVTTTKMITRYKEGFWNRILYVINTHELLEQGYLCPLKYYNNTILEHESIPVNKSKSEFDLTAYEQLISDKEKYIVETISRAEDNHKSVLVFCSSIEQAEKLSKVFPNSKAVSSNTSKKERDQIIQDFKSGATKTIFNCEILTVGFDHPSLDCIVLARPTRSLRLHLQILGRGMRIAEGKTQCDVIDFAGNIKSLGKIEEIKVEKVDGQWNVTSPAFPKGFHMQELYTYRLTMPKKEATTQELL